MPRKKAATKVFDPVRFGEILRKERKSAGFSSAPKFSEAIKQRTGIYIDPDTLHKIERGEREPDVTKLIAICATVYEHELMGWSGHLSSLLRRSQPIEFAFSEPKYALEREYVDSYKNEFGNTPPLEHVSLVCNCKIPDELITGNEKEKEFATSFRSASRVFAKLKENYEIELAKLRNGDPIYF